jgi:hypothetical protein
MASLGCIMAMGIKLLLPPLKDFAASKIQKWWRARKSKAETRIKLLAQNKENAIKRKAKEVGASRIQKWWRAKNDQIEGVKLLAQHKINEIMTEKIKRKIAENLKRKAKQEVCKGAGKCVQWLIRKGAGKCVRWLRCAVI